MLILPLHRPFTRANFPFATIILVIANAFIFFALQVGDNAAMQQAQRYYLDADLGRYEVPAYEEHLRKTTQRDELAALARVPEPGRAAHVAEHTMTDVAFVEALHRGELFSNADDLAAWRPLRDKYETLQQDIFTLRHLMRSSEVDPWRMFASAFLHGDVMHLVGNMIFLVALGLLVEGALGSWRFLAVYLLGALGSSAVSLLWRWGEAGGGLGASGAIAALMGAFCVIWGRQPVRFFYWFGVVFDYVRAPAIWLLPIWLGWEIYNLLANDDLGIGFDAHAGGIITGALIGAVLVGLKQVRHDFIRDEVPSSQRDQRWERAQALLGKMQLAEAEALLLELANEQPQRFDVRLALYRVARNAGRRELLLRRSRELLATPAADTAGVQAQREAIASLSNAGVSLDEAQRIAITKRWMMLGEFDAAESVLSANDTATASSPAQAQLWFELAIGYRDRHANAAHIRALRSLIERHPEQPQAVKARFLLENNA